MSEVARSKVQNDPRTAAMSEVARSKVQNDPRTAAHVRPPVEVRRSEVSAAGAGLFLRCDAPAARPGDLLALYAGVYTPPVPSVTHAADGTSILIPQPALREDGAYVVNLEAGGYLCGAEHALPLERLLCQKWRDPRCKTTLERLLTFDPRSRSADRKYPPRAPDSSFAATLLLLDQGTCLLFTPVFTPLRFPVSLMPQTVPRF